MHLVLILVAQDRVLVALVAQVSQVLVVLVVQKHLFKFFIFKLIGIIKWH